jgi:hypothetical protein
MALGWESTGLHYYLDSDNVVRSGYDSDEVEAMRRVEREDEDHMKNYEDYPQDYENYPHYNLNLLSPSGEAVQTVFDKACMVIGIVCAVALLILLFIN